MTIFRASFGLILLLGAATLCYGIDPTHLDNPALEARYQGLTHELRCMQCQNESIADSPVGLASDLRRQVRDMLLAGKSDEDVRNYMVSRYGEFILFRPRFSARTAWLWLAPLVFMALGVWVAIRVLRQRSALAASDPDVLEADES